MTTLFFLFARLQTTILFSLPLVQNNLLRYRIFTVEIMKRGNNN